METHIVTIEGVQQKLFVFGNKFYSICSGSEMTDLEVILTVGKLKELLSVISDDYHVRITGCGDCSGKATGIVVNRTEPPGEVLIGR